MARDLIVAQGKSKFGQIPAGIRAALAQITSAEELQRPGLKLIKAQTWEELLSPTSTSPTRRRSARKTEGDA